MEASKTLKLIESRILASADNGHRKHLGASVIGGPCARKLWYQFRWFLREEHEARLLRLFNRGHLEEKRFIGYFQDAGITVWEAGEDGSAQVKDSMRVTAHNGHFGGTPDAIAKGVPDIPLNSYCLLEFKTHSSKSFAKVKEEGLMKAKWEHFVQMQIYMNHHSLEYGVYCAVNKDTDELFLWVVNLDQAVAERYLQRAGEIIYAKEPPLRINTSPGFYICKFCHMSQVCHFKLGQVEKNCRTCKHSCPAENGLWLCQLEKRSLNENQQRLGCPKYVEIQRT